MNKFGKVSVITAGLVLPLALLAGNVVTWYYKSSNPNNVDITADLAYLRQTLVTAFVVYGLVWLISLVCGILSLRREKSSDLGKTGLLLLSLITALSLCTAVTAGKISNAEEAYRAQQSQNFFKKL